MTQCHIFPKQRLSLAEKSTGLFVKNNSRLKWAAQKYPKVQGGELLISSFNENFRQYFGECFFQIK